VEMTLMVKALVTFEGVGRMLQPRLDVAAVSRKHVTRILQGQFTAQTISRELLREAPEILDLAVQLPRLLVAGNRFLEQTFDRQPARDPATGVRFAVLAGACLIGGVLAFTAAAPTVLWAGLFALAAVLGSRGK
jgi:ubiquinone biosynthesis protein